MAFFLSIFESISWLLGTLWNTSPNSTRLMSHVMIPDQPWNKWALSQEIPSLLELGRNRFLAYSSHSFVKHALTWLNPSHKHNLLLNLTLLSPNRFKPCLRDIIKNLSFYPIICLCICWWNVRFYWMSSQKQKICCAWLLKETTFLQSMGMLREIFDKCVFKAMTCIAV